MSSQNGSSGMNVLKRPLAVCCRDPITGFHRDGLCRSSAEDLGMHTLCAVMTDEFLAFSASRGNDLSTPIPEMGFSGLAAGDKWCLCVLRWKEALEAGAAPLVDLEATHISALEHVPLAALTSHAVK